MELKDRIKKARAHASLSQAQLAEKVGMGQATLSDLEKGKTTSSRYLITIAKCCGVDPFWLQTGNGIMNNIGNTDHIEIIGGIEPWDDNTPLDDDEIEIPLIKEVELGAGSGSFNFSEFKTNKKLRFSKTELIKQGVNFPSSICVTVSGNSMEPFIQDGSIVGIDTSKTNIVDGKIYAVVIENELARIKQLYRLPNNRVRLRSFNRDEYEDEEYSLEDIRVVGKLFWSSVMWD